MDYFKIQNRELPLCACQLRGRKLEFSTFDPVDTPPPTPHSPPAGFKQFFAPGPIRAPGLSIRGLGIRELMAPCLVQRLHGTPDYLFVLFHDAAIAETAQADRTPEAAGSMMIWPPGKSQCYGNPARRFSHSWIHCEGSKIRRMLRRSGLPLLTPFYVPDPSPFQQCLLDVHRELVSYVNPDLRIVENLLENCLRELARQIAPQEKQTRIPPRLLAARQLINSHASQPLTLDDLARSAGMSAPYFCSQFRKFFGLAPVEYLIQHRMLHATHLLADRNLTIAEIATQVGYNDPFFFSKTFKKHFGRSPREMRNRG